MPNSDLVAALDELSASLSELSEKAETANAESSALRAELTASKARSNRRWHQLLLIIGFDLCLSVFIWRLAIRVNHNTKRITSQSAEARRQCKAVNESSRREIELWNGVLALPQTTANQTEEQKRQQASNLVQFRNLLNTVFVQQNCNGVSKK